MRKKTLFASHPISTQCDPPSYNRRGPERNLPFMFCSFRALTDKANNRKKMESRAAMIWRRFYSLYGRLIYS